MLGRTDGDSVGSVDGVSVVPSVELKDGETVGAMLGVCEGAVGVTEGGKETNSLGEAVGTKVGVEEGFLVGRRVGDIDKVGAIVGMRLGGEVGSGRDGRTEGTKVGIRVGAVTAMVGWKVGSQVSL